ncbi:hypothetical protein COO60DRAFT_517371 [Scenedesmus sp. NREL 46B-D3]|nr:hypothetical protein COO60DRAFT_517371 [Scenedesmus sp. NREL 46B-D3]
MPCACCYVVWSCCRVLTDHCLYNSTHTVHCTACQACTVQQTLGVVSTALSPRAGHWSTCSSYKATNNIMSGCRPGCCCCTHFTSSQTCSHFFLLQCRCKASSVNQVKVAQMQFSIPNCIFAAQAFSAAAAAAALLLLHCCCCQPHKVHDRTITTRCRMAVVHRTEGSVPSPQMLDDFTWCCHCCCCCCCCHDLPVYSVYVAYHVKGRPHVIHLHRSNTTQCAAQGK